MSAVATGSGFVAGAGTAIGGVVGGIAGGIIGGWAGEEAAKKLNVDDGMADFFGNIYQGIKG
ncbi:hypothetical protein [Rothia nasimurium]|uniref:hypothetical protein n=1 Tax=Rothia nasimurium TaxID=85336 RepID=UPI001F2B2C80|nr:hypothetical protein [Rothia nasimurium]